MKEYFYDEKNKMLFDLLSNCGAIRKQQAVEILGIPERRLQSYVKKGLLKRTSVHCWGGEYDRSGIYYLSKKGRDSLALIVKTDENQFLADAPYVSHSPTTDCLLADLYLSLSESERLTWRNREILSETINESISDFKTKFPQEYKEMDEYHGFAACNASYTNKEGEIIYVSVYSSDHRGWHKKEHYAKMMLLLSQPNEVIHFKTLDVKRRKYTELIEW